ncbi:MAG TPA: helix-turn-helix domain-containing protein [Chiayiivirga sp.]|nr:helix-turn-helix domain-containing protein [Chiayiivirga sp.]
MPVLTPLKKPATPDWHWADLMACLRKRGWSVRQIAITEGYNDGGRTLLGAARHPAPKAEAILAAYAGVEHPMLIWPSRYNSDGTTSRRMGRTPMRGQPPVKATTHVRARNPQKAVGA